MSRMEPAAAWEHEPAEFYTGLIARAYPLLRGTHFSADRYRDFISTYGQPALELGCGEDGPFYTLAAEGIDIEGIDSSIDMVRRGAERLEAAGAQASVHHQRMESMDSTRLFASIYCAGPTFNLIPNDELAVRALDSIARHLRSDGAALIPLWVPPQHSESPVGQSVRAREGDMDVRYTVMDEQFHLQQRTRVTTLHYEIHAPTGVEETTRDWVIHWYDDADFRRLAERAGLDVTFTAVDDDQSEAVLRHL